MSNSFEFEQSTNYLGEWGETGVLIYSDFSGLTIEQDIYTTSTNGYKKVEQCVISTMPHEEAKKLRDYLIGVYPPVVNPQEVNPL